MVQTNDNNIDDHVDEEISACLKLENPRSFFLFAGAGSGKTKSLVSALEKLCLESGRKLYLGGKGIGVITYTNAACDEIKKRLRYNPLVEVSTIHSFVWSLIQGFNFDIKEWMKIDLVKDISNLEAQQLTGRPNSKAFTDRIKSIESKRQKLQNLDQIKTFNYNPNGDNRGRASLNHSDVIKIGAEFLVEKPLMQALLINRFPILLIDESQDTNKHLMEAFIHVQSKNKNRFTLGLLGDTMQRIYSDGKVDLGQNLPSDWERPSKIMNHRCPERIVRLINKIRAEVDSQEQQSRSNKQGGIARLFLASNKALNKLAIEESVVKRMADITKDEKWVNMETDVKALILEHHMAAKRMEFVEMFEALHKVESFRTGLLDGTLPSLGVFIKMVLPLIQAHQSGNDFGVAAIVRKYSPLLNRLNLQNSGNNQASQITKAQTAVNKLLELWEQDSNPLFLDILLKVHEFGLFEIHESLRPILLRNQTEQEFASTEIETTGNDEAEENEDEEDSDQTIDALDIFLRTPFSQIENYVNYIGGKARFDTHQGVKGLEFPRVMVIIDDTEARGFLFSYEKLFGVKEKTKTDVENELTNADTSIARTRRLFYVTCSRAEESLAIIAYTDDPEKLKENVINQEWFDEEEIEILN